MKFICNFAVLTLCLFLASQVSAQLNFSDGSVQTTAASEGNNIIPLSGKGTNSENGSALRNAISGVTDATSTNQYTILLASSIYDVGSSPLIMKSYVHIQGLNNQVSRITGSGTVTITGADNSSLMDLKVSSTANGSTLYHASGIFSEHYSVDFVIPSLTGNLKGVAVTSAADISLYRCRIGAFEDLDNGSGNTIGIFASDPSSHIELFGCIVGMTETNSSGDITAILIESYAEGRISKSDIDVEPFNGSTGTGLKFTDGTNVTVIQSTVEAEGSSVALSTSGVVTVTAINSLFNGTVSTAYYNSGSDHLVYSQCSNNFSEL